jgi:hypothetical protein
MQYVNLGLLLLVFYTVYYVIERLRPILRSPKQFPLSYDQLSFKYQGVFSQTVWLILGGTLLLTVILKYVLYFLVLFRLSFLADAALSIAPPDIAIWLLAFVFAFILALYVVSTFYYYKLLTDWEEYLHYVNERLRFDLVYYFNYIGRMASFGLVLITYLFFDWFYSFGSEEIKINDFWGLGTTKYAYMSMVDVYEMDAHTDVLSRTYEMPYYMIKFEDGTYWNSLTQGFPSFEKNKATIDQYVVPKLKGNVIKVGT